MNPNAFLPRNVYYCELSETQPDFLGNNWARPELKTIATQVSRPALNDDKKKKFPWGKLLSPIIKWWKRLLNKTSEHRGGFERKPPANPLKFHVSKENQASSASSSSLPGGRSYGLKVGSVEAAFWKTNGSACAPLALSVGYADLLGKICGDTVALDVNAKIINLRVLKTFMEDEEQKRLVTQLERLEAKLDDLLAYLDNREQNTSAAVNPNLIHRNPPSFTSRKCSADAIENTSCPSLIAGDP